MKPKTKKTARRRTSTKKPAVADDFIEVPAGPFKMGSDKTRDREAFDNECPQHEVTLSRYFVGRDLVTVAQFKAYLAATKRPAPHASTIGSEPNLPVTYVSWQDAVAYCEWLTATLRKSSATPKAIKTLLNDKKEPWAVTLPTEAQWEKAARGTDGRIYPWGDDFDAKKLNCYQSGFGRTTPVGQFPSGAGPYGCHDMAGNVWEWTRSPWGPAYPLPPHSDEATAAAPLRVVRGGSFDFSPRSVRAASRNGVHPVLRYVFIGFRVVVSPFRL